MKNRYMELSIYGEKTYRVFLDLIKHELDKLDIIDITAIQAFILMNISGNVVTIGEVLTRGYYIGSNASYNLRKMITNGYLAQSTTDYDKRTCHLRITEKGKKLCETLGKILDMRTAKIMGTADLEKGLSLLKKVENSLKDSLRMSSL
ncbi:MAG: MarR family winged helix-turn-helix transcriptional regulator [Holosporales bacterium]|jgi:DNA-binding MarR family transcriptional regulator|nr:MarR family winged helix-turn-helix transcriptional regulator [Holosporales bacterium]